MNENRSGSFPNRTPSQWDHETDVVVVGGGGTGLAAALEAARNGARVLLLEKNEQLGGTTSIAVGSFTAACTSMQKAAGIQDDPEWHNEDMGKFAAHREVKNNWDLRGFFARHAAETFEWLTELGLEFHGPSPEPPNRVPRMHNVVPNAKAYVAFLHRRILELGAEIWLNCPAVRLFRSDEGFVVGLEAERGGTKLTVRAHKGIVLAAGDYSNGYEVKRGYLPSEVALVEGINPLATGDGHRLGEGVGAELLNMDLVYGPEIRFIAPPRPPFAQLLPANPVVAKILGKGMSFLPKSVLTRMVKRLLVTWQHPETSLFEKGAILVNKEGKRFTDETAQPELGIPNQPEKIAYIILDRNLASMFSEWPNFISTAPDIAYAYIQDYKRLRPDVYTESSTLPGLAEQIGVSPDTFEGTLRQYNQAVRGESEDSFGRKSFGPVFEEPPFYALGPVKSWIVTTEGGLRINEDMQVLDSEGHVIRGLYAGGSNGQGGMVVWGHGLHIAWAFTSGRLAGRNAAKDE